MLRTVNRVLLALTGLGLFVLGGGVLLGGLDLQRHWDFSMPTWWPFTGPDDVLLTTRDRTRFHDSGWWWPAVIAVLAVLLLLALWWLLAQLRRRRLREVLIDSGDGEEVQLKGRALGDAMAAEAQAQEGVSRAQVRLAGRRTAPEAHIRLVLEAQSRPADALVRVTREALGHARDSARLERLPAEIRLQEERHRARRVS